MWNEKRESENADGADSDLSTFHRLYSLPSSGHAGWYGENGGLCVKRENNGEVRSDLL